MMGSGYAINPFTGKMEWVGRLKRPGYYRDADNELLIHVDASATKLVHLCIGNRVYLVQSGMTCNLGAVGPGGLDMGEVQANTPYYLYAVISGGNAHLVASVRAPGDGGPQGYTPWTYIGAVMTNGGTADFNTFMASGGVYVSNSGILDTATHTGDTNVTELAMPCPVTAINRYCRLNIVAGAALAGSSSRASGENSSLSSLAIVSPRVSATHYTFGWIPHLVAQKVYIDLGLASYSGFVTLMGWQEDPSIFP